MRHRTRSQSLVLPFRSWLAVAGVTALIALSLTLAVLNTQSHPVPDAIRHGVQDAVTPIIGGLSKPASVLDAFGARIRELTVLDEQNRRLRDENAALLHWQIAGRKLAEENAALRGLLAIPPRPEMHFVTAPVVSGNGSPYGRALMLDAGQADGLVKDQAVITDEGLVGRVIDAGRSSAQVLLITDINSRIPVEIAETGEKAILTGTGKNHPELVLANQSAKVEPGQKVVTADDGGVFPAGFAVGEVRTKNGKADVTPYVNATRLGFVRIVDQR